MRTDSRGPVSCQEMDPPAGFQRLTSRKGSHPGGVCTDGARNYYWKVPPTPDHARNEVLAAELYRLAGVSVPRMVLAQSVTGQWGVLSPMVEGPQRHFRELFADRDYMRALQQGFSADVWLANWDVLGSSCGLANIATDQTGRPVRVDMGGALMFRALGAPKGSAFNSAATEWWTMRNPQINPASAMVFKHISHSDLEASARSLSRVNSTELAAKVEASGFDGAVCEDLTEVLLARLSGIALYARAGV